MAAQEQHYLDLQGLTTYDTKIKAEIPKPDETTITTDTDGKLKVKKAPSFSGNTLVFS